jgi:hypothetical protein
MEFVEIGWAWVGWCGSERGRVASSCERGNEPSSSYKVLRNYRVAPQLKGPQVVLFHRVLYIYVTAMAFLVDISFGEDMLDLT